MGDVVWDRICNHLISQGISTFAPGAHQGLVVDPYVVVKPAEESRFLQFSSSQKYYDLLCYAKTITALGEFKEVIKEHMKELFPLAYPTHNESTPYYDDSVKGWMSTLEYRSYKKIHNFK